MPKAVFIVCSQSGSLDRDTGALSLFNIIDKLQVRKVGDDKPTEKISFVEPLRMKIVSTWMRHDDDIDAVFEFECFGIFPNGLRLEITKHEFEFKLPFQRLLSEVMGIFPFDGSGILKVHARLRKKGTEDWLDQEYPIVIEDVGPEKTKDENANKKPESQTA